MEETNHEKVTDLFGHETTPEIDVRFQEFLTLMSTQVLFAIGATAHPETGKKMVNFPMARKTIDTLDMLKTKTQGNLTTTEEELLDSVLHELRARYVEAAGAAEENE